MHTPEGLRDSFWLQSMVCGFKAAFDCIKAFSETDFTEDLKKFDLPTLILHGDDDQIVPIGAAALLSSKIVKGATLRVYPGLPHGMCSTIKIRSTRTCWRSSGGAIKWPRNRRTALPPFAAKAGRGRS